MIAIKQQTVLLLCSMLILLAATVSASVDIQEQKVVIDVDYNHFDSENLKFIDVTGTFTLTSSDSTNSTVTPTITGLPADYTVDTISPVTLAPGQSQAVAFTIHVPHKKASGTATIGTLNVKDTTGTVLSSKPLIQNTKSMLSLQELKVTYVTPKDQTEDQSFTDTNSNFKLDNGVKAGSDVKFVFTIQNLFDRNYDSSYSNIDYIELRVEPDDKNLINGTFDEKYKFDSLDARAKENQEITFTVGDNADTTDYIFDITLTGEDGKGFSHEVTRQLQLRVQRANNDVRIVTAEVIPPQVSCEKTIDVNVIVKNYGTSDQTYTTLMIYNKKLGIQENVPYFKLPRYTRSDSVWDRTFSYTLPANIAAGMYPLDVNVAINKDIAADSKSIPVVIGKCATPTQDTTKSGSQINSNTEKAVANVVAPATTIAKKETVATTPTSEKVSVDGSSSTIIKTVEDPYTNEDIIAGILITAVVVIFAFITWFIVLLTKK